jgi:class 3 adenylate cyclase
MPLFMDRHDNFEGSPLDVAHLHLRDVEVQGKYGARYITYWIDYPRKQAFCFVEAPSAEQAIGVHSEAHGGIPSTIIEVDAQAVEDFMGSIADNPVTADPASLDQQPSLRTILFSDMEESTALTQRLGDDGMMEVLRVHNEVLRDAIAAGGGREVKHTGDGIMASFAAASRAVECAIAAQRAFQAHNNKHPSLQLQVRIGLTAGEPVVDGQDLFGASVQLAKRISEVAGPGQIFVSNVIQELCLGKQITFLDAGEHPLKGFDQPFHLSEVDWGAN